ncbi:unnamed protein product [Discula destructiva]
MDEDENPGLIFEAEDGADPHNISHVPLVLTHDGGGTCVSYYCLDPLGRPTYEIHNPRYFSQKPWQGGIAEMARYYVSLIHKSVPRGRILLGGWSFGGILSLEMARILADDPYYNVLGIVMVDSICPGSVVPKDWKGGITFKGQFSERTSQETIERVKWCFAEAIKAISDYKMPSWDEDQRSKGCEPLTSENGGRNGKDRSTHTFLRPKCPPAILLRAREAVPINSEAPHSVDLVRNDRALGWNTYRDGFFQEIVDVPGHHFSIFAFENLDKITECLIEACNKLEGRNRVGRAPA